MLTGLSATGKARQGKGAGPFPACRVAGKKETHGFPEKKPADTRIAGFCRLAD
jgi:hypothetical protein